MALNYGFNLEVFRSRAIAAFASDIQKYGTAQARKAAIKRARAQSAQAFLEWTKKQAELAMEEMSDAAPQRSGNLSESLFLTPDGNDWGINVDEERAPYAKWVLGGRGPIFASRTKFLQFNDTRQGWRPMSNPARVSGINAQKYPYTGNLRRKHTIPKVNGAPSVDFPGEGFERWDRDLLPQQTQILRQQISEIILENGGRVIRST